jgi:hypothetical protein
MADQRFRALTRIPYAQAVAALTRYARASTAEFSYGPLRVDAMENQGLVVSASEDELASIVDLLSLQVPGLYAVEELLFGSWRLNGLLGRGPGNSREQRCRCTGVAGQPWKVRHR